MIIVIGSPWLRGSGSDAVLDGLAASIARAAAGAGARIELIGKVGDDPAGDAVLLALAHSGIGHVAVLRDPARPTLVLPERGEPLDEAGLADAVATDPADVGNPVGGDPAPDQDVPAPVLEPMDANLALRYLTDFSLVVTVHATPEVLAEAVAASGYAEAHLVVVVPAGTEAPDGLPSGALAIAVAEDDASAGAAIGRYAAAVDRGDDAGAAYVELTATGRA